MQGFNNVKILIRVGVVLSSHHKILFTNSVTWSKVRTVDPKLLHSTVEKFTNWHSGFGFLSSQSLFSSDYPNRTSYLNLIFGAHH